MKEIIIKAIIKDKDLDRIKHLYQKEIEWMLDDNEFSSIKVNDSNDSKFDG